MRRYGEAINKTINYKVRVGVYGIITVNDKILLTDQEGHEIQLPGGGVDAGEQKFHALIREIREETGWKVMPIRHIGSYQRFVFMPEYAFWAQKICHIYSCRGIYPITPPTEDGHVPLVTTPDLAIKLIQNSGDISFLKQFYNI